MAVPVASAGGKPVRCLPSCRGFRTSQSISGALGVAGLYRLNISLP